MSGNSLVKSHPLPPRKSWRFRRCFYCDRQTLVAPGVTVAAEGELITLALCTVGFERVGRQLHRARMRLAMHNNASSVAA